MAVCLDRLSPAHNRRRNVSLPCDGKLLNEFVVRLLLRSPPPCVAATSFSLSLSFTLDSKADHQSGRCLTPKTTDPASQGACAIWTFGHFFSEGRHLRPCSLGCHCSLTTVGIFLRRWKDSRPSLRRDREQQFKQNGRQSKLASTHTQSDLIKSRTSNRMGRSLVAVYSLRSCVCGQSL